MKKILSTCMFLICCFFVFSQKVDYSWLIGGGGSDIDTLFRNTLLDFNSIPPTKKLINNENRFDTFIALICDESGSLSFYTNGTELYNKNHQIVQNGENFQLNWDDAFPLPQNGLILPQPNYSNRFYLFSIDYFAFAVPQYPYTVVSGKPNYSIIDGYANNGDGLVSLKKAPISNDSLIPALVTATRHGNGRDWWILGLPNYTSNNIISFLADPVAIHKAGTQPIEPLINSGLQAVFSPNGAWYSFLEDRRDHPDSLDYNRLTLYPFDRCTGQLGTRISKDIPGPARPGGAAFSPNSRFLYLSLWDQILQYDLQSPDILNSETVVAEYDGFVDTVFQFILPQRFYLAQLAPDNKIYISVSNYNSRYLHTIESPDEPGLACNVQQHSVHLPTFNNWVVPNIPFPRLYNWVGSPCDTLYSKVADMDAQYSMSVWPNPASETIHVETHEESAFVEGRFQVFDAAGCFIAEFRLSKSHPAMEFSVADFPAGLYFWQFFSKDRIASRGKFVVQD